MKMKSKRKRQLKNNSIRKFRESLTSKKDQGEGRTSELEDKVEELDLSSRN